MILLSTVPAVPQHLDPADVPWQLLSQTERVLECHVTYSEAKWRHFPSVRKRQRGILSNV